MRIDVARHISELQALTAMARFRRRPLCSNSQAAIVALAPTQVSQVSNECWLLSPLLKTASSVGR